MYTDPDGEIISTVITGIVGFFKALGRSIGAGFTSIGNKEKGSQQFSNAWKDYGKEMSNAWKIDMGMFKTDPNKSTGGRVWEFISRFTWQAPQTLLGNLIMTGGNIAGKVNDVSYGYGMTAVDMGLNGSAISVGNYTAGPKGYKADWRDHLFVHEYGHYIQSQRWGPLYLLSVGLPSIQSTTHITGNPNAPRHRDRWFEARASRNAANYFDKHYGSGKDGYLQGSPDFFDKNSFIDGSQTPSPYINPRTGYYNYSSHPISGKFHWTDIWIYIPGLGFIPFYY